MSSQAENPRRLAHPEAGSIDMPRTQKFLAAGGVIGALATSSCCIVPLVLFGLGVSGAWIANLTRLAPYQPYFIAPASPAATGCCTARAEGRARMASSAPGRCQTGSSRAA